jgi:hypothetical protein
MKKDLTWQIKQEYITCYETLKRFIIEIIEKEIFRWLQNSK